MSTDLLLKRLIATLDIGLVPVPHEYGGQYVITIQIAPIEHLADAKTIADGLRKTIGKRMHLSFAEVTT